MARKKKKITFTLGGTKRVLPFTLKKASKTLSK